MSDPSKIAGPLRRKVTAEGSEDVRVSPDDELLLYVEAEPGRVADATTAVQNHGVRIRSETAGYIAADVPAKEVLSIAQSDAVRHVQERRVPRAHQVADKYITEGVGVMNADTLHSDGITGSGARVAVIDHYFHTDNPKYSNRIVATVGDSTYFTSDSEYSGARQHGTACAEIVADVAPDAELVLATTRGSQSFSQIMDEIETYDPDAATMSLGYYTGLRIDGQDQISTRVDQFTDDGRLFAVSAGNEADGDTWDGAFTNNGNGLMEFDSSLSTPTRYPVIMDPQTYDAEVHVHWDADWDQDNQRYKARLYENESDPVGDSSAIVVEKTTNPVEIVALSPSQHGSSTATYYLEVEKINATGSEHFDLFTWARASLDGPTTARRSLGIPATSPDQNTLSVAAVQATSVGRTNEEHLKPYSSQGPTQDGRRGLDVAAPSMVSTTKVGDYGGYGALDDGGGFNGTSAASPHVGGACGLLWDSDISATRDERRDALFDTGRSIVDSNVSAPGANNTKIGYGYIDAEAAETDLTAVLAEPLSVKWTSNDLGGDAQFNRPAIDANQVYIGGLQNAFYALSRDDGESVGWSKDRGTKPGLSDSSGHLWTDPTQPKVFFGSGQGKLYAVDADDGSEHWSGSDIPDLGSAITSSPTSDGGTIVAGTNDGRVLAWDGSTATQQWEVSVDGGVYSDLTAADGLVYVTTENGTLHVLSASDGTQQWKDNSFGAFGSSSPALGNNSVYVAADEVHAFDAASSKTNQWTSSGYGGTAGSNPTYHNGTVYVGSADGNLYALDAANGSENWTFSTGSPVASTPAINDDGTRIAVASMDATLYLLDSSGNQVETVSIPGDTRASPVIDNGELFLPTASGVTHAFE